MAIFNTNNMPIESCTFGMPLSAIGQVSGDTGTRTTGDWSSGGQLWAGAGANNNTKTLVLALPQFTLPQGYAYPGGIDTDAGETLADADIVLNFRAKVSANAATSQQIDAQVYVSDLQGGVGSDIVSTAAQNLTTSWATYSFTCDGTTLLIGSQLNAYMRAVVNDSGGAGTITAQIGAVWWTINVRG